MRGWVLTKNYKRRVEQRRTRQRLALSLSRCRSVHWGVLMSPDLWVPAVTTVVIVAIVCGSSYSLIKMYMQRGSETDVPPAGLKEIHDGLGQLQQAVDAIAIEVERLSEGQRFKAKLLAERESELAQIPPANREG